MLYISSRTVAAAHKSHLLSTCVQSSQPQPILGREIHAISSSSKPISSWLARDGIQECREACGGHGFLAGEDRTHCCHKDCTALTAVQSKDLGMGIAFVVMHSDCSMMCSPFCIGSYNNDTYVIWTSLCSSV